MVNALRKAFKGGIIGEVDPQVTTSEEIGLLMAGGTLNG